MNKNRKTVVSSILIIAVLVSMYFVVKNINKPTVTEGDKAIQIIVLDKMNEEVYNETLNTDTLLLGELLDEINKTKETFVFDDSEYGRFITEIKVLKLEAGEFWLFDSENNKVCKAEEFCPGIDNLAIEDKDIFTFTILAPAHGE